MARLIVKSEDGSSNTLELKPGDAVGIGRDADNQIPLPDARGASRKHCRITSVPSGGSLVWELSDLGATNKTRVNGRPVDKKVLSTGDVIAIGTAEITFEDPKEEERLKDAGSKGVCYLEWVSGEKKGDKVWLDTPRVTMGRRESNTIPLDDRMSSGHHAEVTKDLNGYTVRDLGSTNGTLVNGEPTTEATLSHGSRIRIGNSRFVFKDPSMKDIEIELKDLDDDDGWGMMGDIDLSKARGGKGGLVLLVLLAGVIGAGAFFFTQMEDQAQVTADGDGAGLSLIAGGDMEDEELIEVYWAAEDDESPVRISTTKRGGGQALSLRHTGGSEEDPGQPVLVSYAEEFPALASKGLRIQANVRSRGDAPLVAVWRNWRETGEGEAPRTGGRARLTSTVSLGTGAVDTIATKPSWAESVVFGVRLAPGSSATVDDVSLTIEDNAGEPAREVDCPGDPKAYLDPSGGLDIVNGMTVLLVGAHPVVELQDGTVLTGFLADEIQGSGTGPFTVKGHFPNGDDKVSASITWSRMDNDEGLHAQIESAQAAKIGLTASMPRAQVGVSIGVVTTAAGSIQAAAGETLEGVRRTLCGNPNPDPGTPRTLVSFVPEGEATTTLSLHDAVDGALIDVRHMTDGGSASMHVVTNYGVQLKAAQESLLAARRLVDRQPGRGIEALREIVAVYPYIEAVRDQARSVADKADSEARTEIEGFQQALADFRIFGSRDTLVVLDERIARMAERYPSRGATNGEHENRVAEITAQAADARAAWYSENAGRELSRLERLAELLSNVQGYEPMAAIFYRTILDRFGHLEADDAFGRRVKRAKERFDALQKSHGDSIPALPAKQPK